MRFMYLCKILTESRCRLLTSILALCSTNESYKYSRTLNVLLIASYTLLSSVHIIALLCALISLNSSIQFEGYNYQLDGSVTCTNCLSTQLFTTRHDTIQQNIKLNIVRFYSIQLWQTLVVIAFARSYRQ